MSNEKKTNLSVLAATRKELFLYNEMERSILKLETGFYSCVSHLLSMCPGKTSLMDYTLIPLSVKLNIKISTLSAIIMKTK
jgi:hypothetical protein